MLIASLAWLMRRPQKTSHFRLDPKIKARVARAAAITGQGLTAFAVSTLSEKADQILARRDTILLTSDEYSFFLNALAEDRKPSKRSVACRQAIPAGSPQGCEILRC